MMVHVLTPARKVLLVLAMLLCNTGIPYVLLNMNNASLLIGFGAGWVFLQCYLFMESLAKMGSRPASRAQQELIQDIRTRGGKEAIHSWIINNLGVKLDLSGADLTGTNLCGADLSRANLSRAILVYADLRDANLDGADLRHAHLQDAQVEATQLKEAAIYGAHGIPKDVFAEYSKLIRNSLS